MTTTPLTRNITRTFRAATDEDRVNGREWYARARRLSESLAELHPSPVRNDDFEFRVRRAAGVIAALSPRLAWRKNVEYAELAYELRDLPLREFTARIPTLNLNAAKAHRILSGEDPDDVLGGPKVRAFYFTITNPDDARAVVVDRHAIDVAFGEVLTDATRPVMKGKNYEYISGLYVNAAKIISRETGERWTPAWVQAATWINWRREYAAAYHGEA
jgi:hypothetical protein